MDRGFREGGDAEDRLLVIRQKRQAGGDTAGLVLALGEVDLEDRKQAVFANALVHGFLAALAEIQALSPGCKRVRVDGRSTPFGITTWDRPR